jgi:hypothetical protein
MALALTCACGAHFELDETLSGREVACPECAAPVRVPGLESAPLRTSGWALASVVLATVGAFTLIGTLTAIVFGFVALRSIRQHREQVTGTGFALFGIIAGFLLTGLTVLALAPGELFGLGGWWRERNLRALIDRSGPLTIDRGFQGYTVTRPSKRWGAMLVNVTPEPSLEGMMSGCDLILLDPRLGAYLDVRIDHDHNRSSLDQCQDLVLKEFEPLRDDAFDRRPAHHHAYTLVRDELLPGGPTFRAKELIIETKRGGHGWWFCVHLIKVDNGGPLYIVRGYVPQRRRAHAEDDLRKGLTSFQLTNP